MPIGKSRTPKVHPPTDLLLNEQITPIHTHDESKSHLLLPDGSRHVGVEGSHEAAARMAPVVDYDGECEEMKQVRMVSRRTMLAGLGVGAMLAAVPFNRYAITPAHAQTSTEGNLIVGIFLRGGLDGLGAVAPLSDSRYQVMRPSMGLNDSTLLHLDGTGFGFNPGLSKLGSMFNEGGPVGVIHATGHPDESRSHFIKQHFHESGAMSASMRSGWLGRYLASSGSPATFRAMTMGPTAAFMMAHENPTLAMSRLGDFSVKAPVGAVKDQVVRTIRDLWGSTDGVGGAAVDKTIEAAMSVQQLGKANTQVKYPSGLFGDRMKELAQVVKAGVGLEVACVDFDGWDMHTDMGRSPGTGWLFQQLQRLDEAMTAFWEDIGPAWRQKTIVMTMSEFGRTGSTNGGNGSDHGYGNVMLTLGGRHGVHGAWPGLSPSSLNSGDLDVVNDYRAVVAEAMTGHMGVSPAQLAQILPDYSPEPIGAFVAPSQG